MRAVCECVRDMSASTRPAHSPQACSCAYWSDRRRMYVSLLGCLSPRMHPLVLVSAQLIPPRPNTSCVEQPECFPRKNENAGTRPRRQNSAPKGTKTRTVTPAQKFFPRKREDAHVDANTKSSPKVEGKRTRSCRHTCEKGWKSRANSSSLMPTPVSATDTDACSELHVTVTRMWPSCVNLIAVCACVST